AWNTSSGQTVKLCRSQHTEYQPKADQKSRPDANRYCRFDHRSSAPDAPPARTQPPAIHGWGSRLRGMLLISGQLNHRIRTHQKYPPMFF
ncbi:MAG: hypothetical protein KAY42_05305, partial [Oscillospiraceae bacterium]|nr:hypothetical protein [Oscillospiraceae bacterium]